MSFSYSANKWMLLSVCCLLAICIEVVAADDSTAVERWQAKQVSIRTAKSVISLEDTLALRSVRQATASPKRGKVSVSGEEREVLVRKLQAKLGTKLLPPNISSLLEIFHQQEAGATVTRFQISYRRGLTRIGIAGELDGQEPKNVTVIMAEKGRSPDLTAMLPTGALGKKIPTEMIEIEDMDGTRLKVSSFAVE